ncbi:MAG: 16S rRNA (guanine(527)-N(7))-methyltransferase RsmG [Sulfitobacter sp.]
MSINVSRETIERLEIFQALVRKWSPKINLVAKSTLDHLWERHILDSVQLYGHAPKFNHWVDIGSGGGFPGIVMAVIAVEEKGGAKFTLIESDQRKSVFLRTAIRELGLNATVLAQRIEAVEPTRCDVISARALHDLNGLLEHAERHLVPSGTALFMKGARWEEEHINAQKYWSYDLEAVKSTTDPSAAILKIKDIARV